MDAADVRLSPSFLETQFAMPRVPMYSSSHDVSTIRLMIINFHVGIPRVGAELLQAAAPAVDRSGRVGQHILPQRSYKALLRGVVNSATQSAPGDESSFRKAETLIRSLAQYQTVAASQHALLGNPSDLIASRKKFPRISSRIRMLSELFGTHSLVLHLSIKSQSEYVGELKEDELELLSDGSMPSWAELIRLIRAVAPGRKVVVWDFEQPEKIALAFLISLLDTNDLNLIDEWKRFFAERLDLLKPTHANQSLDGQCGLTSRLHARYEADLNAISSVDGVSLMRSEAIPEEFHIR